MAGSDWFWKQLASGAVRKALAFLAGWALAHGLLESSEMPVVLARAAEIAPAVVSIAWDWYAKRRAAKEHQVAVDSSPLTETEIKQQAKTVVLAKAA